MKTRPLVAVFLALAGSAALAQQNLTTIEVRADSEDGALSIACQDPTRPTLEEVERLLGTSVQLSHFRTKLMRAAAEACKAGEPRIKVMHDVASLSLRWKAVR